jgi:hypothetical protein
VIWQHSRLSNLYLNAPLAYVKLPALEFAFESDPAGSYERIGKKLPFGCHAWAKHDRTFWERMGAVEAKLRN